MKIDIQQTIIDTAIDWWSKLTTFKREKLMGDYYFDDDVDDIKILEIYSRENPQLVVER